MSFLRRRWGILVVAALAVTWLAVLILNPRPASLCDNVREDDFSINFGLSREPITRTYGLAVPGGSASVDTARQVTAVLDGDLVRDGTVAQFPADQITLSAKVNDDDTTVEVRALVDPFGANPVAEGCYRGDVIVVRGNGQSDSLPMVVDVAEREEWSAALAFTILLAGALIGLAIKWITESLTPLAESKRRLARFRQTLVRRNHMDDNLPVAVLEIRDDIDQLIKHQDITDLKSKFEKLDEVFAVSETAVGTISDIRTNLDAQKAKLDRLWRNLPEDVVNDLAALWQTENGRLNQIRGGEWTAATIETRMQELEELRRYVGVVNRFFETYPRHFNRQEMQDAYDLLTTTNGDVAVAGTKIKEVNEKQLTPITWTGENASENPLADKTPPHQKTVRDTWLFRHVRLLAALVSALIVTFVGFSTEYLNQPAFEDNMDDWLNLFLWAAIIELSGVSVLDVVARLSANAQPTR